MAGSARVTGRIAREFLLLAPPMVDEGLRARANHRTARVIFQNLTMRGRNVDALWADRGRMARAFSAQHSTSGAVWWNPDGACEQRWSLGKGARCKRALLIANGERPCSRPGCAQQALIIQKTERASAPRKLQRAPAPLEIKPRK